MTVNHDIPELLKLSEFADAIGVKARTVRARTAAGWYPEAFRIGEGRLLLFVDEEYTFFDGDWVPDEHELLGQADKNWKAMSGESARSVPPAEWNQDGEYNLDDESLAIEGYDPVSYFPEGGGKPREGKKTLEFRHENVRYRFANKANLAAFQADPEKYKPQHGGWCSYAMGATQSETIRKVVLPAALPGIVGGILLAVSRAIGETMIVVMAAGLSARLTANPLESVTTVTVQIVTLLTGDQEFDSAKTLAAFALGLTLFVVTLLLNIIALHVVRKYREQYE